MSLKEKGQYALAFGVVAVMLFLVGFPIVLLGFFGAVGFLVWKLMTAESRGDTRRIFEFYLNANEILRQDERRWFGFEIKDAIGRGEAVLRSMTSAPPLVHFALGALYHKIGDYSLADKHLSIVADGAASNELTIVFPTRELRDYVRILRKIERSPAEAPLTSAAVRALERARKNRVHAILDDCRSRLAEAARAPLPAATITGDTPNAGDEQKKSGPRNGIVSHALLEVDYEENDEAKSVAKEEQPRRRRSKTPLRDGRKTISEVLHDIYDTNA